MPTEARWNVMTGRRLRMLRSLGIASFLVAVLALVVTSRVEAQADEVPPNTATILNRVLPSVVNISVRKDQSAPAKTPDGGMVDSKVPAPQTNPLVKGFVGSGFVIDPSGVIVTNYHVVENAFQISVTTFDGSILSGTTLTASRNADIALVKVTPLRPLVAAEWGDSDKIEIGDQVFAAGNPFGIGVSISSGIVSALNRNIQNSPYDDYIQTDAAINHGNSGGPLFDTSGKVIGVDSAIISPVPGSVGVGFALPSSSARFVVDRLRTFGWIRPSWVGMKVQQVTPELANAMALKSDYGSIVSWIIPGGPAEKAGLQIGDIVQRLNSSAPSDDRALLRDLVRLPIGTPVDFKINHDGQERTIQMVTEEWPRNRFEKQDAPLKVVQPKLFIPHNLGLTLAEITPDQKKGIGMETGLPGVMIKDILPDSDPIQRGVVIGDVILRVQEKPVDTPAEVQAAIDAARADKRNYVAMLILPKVRTVPGPRWFTLTLTPDGD